MPMELRHLRLERPLAALDLESTGVDPAQDRIVEVADLKPASGTEPFHFRRLIRPGVPVPPRPRPSTASVTRTSWSGRGSRPSPRAWPGMLADADLASVGLTAFDLPLLQAGFARAGIRFPLTGRAVVEMLRLYRARHPRDLAAAVRIHCRREHGGARRPGRRRGGRRGARRHGGPA